jgi:hypothetical protein
VLRPAARTMQARLSQWASILRDALRWSAPQSLTGKG